MQLILIDKTVLICVRLWLVISV